MFGPLRTVKTLILRQNARHWIYERNFENNFCGRKTDEPKLFKAMFMRFIGAYMDWPSWVNDMHNRYCHICTGRNRKMVCDKWYGTVDNTMHNWKKSSWQNVCIGESAAGGDLRSARRPLTPLGRSDGPSHVTYTCSYSRYFPIIPKLDWQVTRPHNRSLNQEIYN